MEDKFDQRDNQLLAELLARKAAIQKDLRDVNAAVRRLQQRIYQRLYKRTKKNE